MLIGVIGKTNVGKSTLFKALTLAEVEISPRPFTTIKPNRGIAYVRVRCPCTEFKLKCNPVNSFCIDGNRFAPVEILDVAGLVPGAHLGRGLGNKFLDDLRQADCLIHVVDISGTTDENGNPTTGYDPCNDVRFVEQELDEWIFSIVSQHFDRIVRVSSIKGEEFAKNLARQLSGLGISLDHITATLHSCGLDEMDPKDWGEEELRKFLKNLRKLAKPMIIAANKIDLPGATQNLERIKKEFPELRVIPCCAEAELALRQAARKGMIKYIPGDDHFEVIKVDEAQARALELIDSKILKRFGSTGVQEVLNEAVLGLLKCVVVFPVADEHKLTDTKGNVLPDAIVMPNGTTILDLAYKIHSMIGERFVRAVDCRSSKLLGKEYKLRHLDVVKIIS